MSKTKKNILDNVWSNATEQIEEKSIKTLNKSRFAWSITGSGHFLDESINLFEKMPNTDLFLSPAAEEVLPMYGYKIENLKSNHTKVFRDKTSSSVPVGMLYKNHYHTLIISPTTSNTIAKCVFGISDTLPTNMFAQAGKLGILCILFACDTEPVVITRAPKEWVELKPRKIEFSNLNLLKNFSNCIVVESINDLKKTLNNRIIELGLSWKKSSF
jgi:flavoprotein